MQPARSIDILILTALREEYDQVLAVDAGALEGSSWQTRSDSFGYDVTFRAFLAENGQPLQIAVTWAPDMGGIAAASTAARLIAEFKPRCLAMCGICAGRRGNVQIGDVIIADRLWMHDVGKRIVEYDNLGNPAERFAADVLTYNLRADWKEASEDFRIPEELVASWGKRPVPSDLQAYWILERISKGEDPRNHPDRESKVPDFVHVVEQLWKKKLLKDGTLTLTRKGKTHIDKLLLLDPDGLRELSPMRVHVGSLASGAAVMRGTQLFERLSTIVRNVLGVDMEAAAIGAVAQTYRDQIQYMIVMKGVADYADEWKHDSAQTFAARASAECLIAFLRKHLPPVDRFGDIIDPGSALRPTAPGPSHLLHAKYRYISFYEKAPADIWRRLHAFCADSAPVSLSLIHGEGGMGKTRLMIEYCQYLRTNGWVAGFLSKLFDAERFADLVNSDLPALVVIDYAEARPDLAALLMEVARIRARKAPLRLVLLARNADDWWASLRQRSELKTLLSMRLPQSFGPPVELSERAQIVQETARQFAAIRGKPFPTAPIPSIDDDRFARPLYLHLAALAWVEGLSFTAESMLDDLLEHEERFWRTQVESSRDAIEQDIFIDQTRNAVAAATLCGGMANSQSAEALLCRVNNGTADDRVLALLRRLYPGAASTYTSPLQPDLLGEAQVWRTMVILQRRGDAPTAFLDRVFMDQSDPVLRTGFTVLGRLSVTHAADVRPWIAHLLTADLESRAVLALEAAKILGDKTAHAWVGLELAGALERAGTLELAQRLDEVGIPDWTVSLRAVSVWVSKKRLMVHSSPDVRAARLINLGNQYSELGQREAALESTQEAVDIFRTLAEQRPEPFLQYLARGLNNLGLRQSALGGHEQALRSLQEAVDIYEKLVEHDSKTFLPNLATCLHNLGIRQRESGQCEAALASTQKVIDIRRKLVQQNADKFLRNLATSLDSLGTILRELGQRDAALVSAREAVDIHQKLAEEHPDAFLPNLAMSLNNLGTIQSALGQHEAALMSTQQAVDIRRKLCLQRQDRFLPDLAASLNNLGLIQSIGGEHQAALAAAEEATGMYRQLNEQYPQVFGDYLARTVDNLQLVQRKSAFDTWAERSRLFTDVRSGAFVAQIPSESARAAERAESLHQRDIRLGTLHKNRTAYRARARNEKQRPVTPAESPDSPLMWLQARNIGPIKNAEITFGDLTVLVGPQATGKSIFLQIFKLGLDFPAVQAVFRRSGIDWQYSQEREKPFFKSYFGEGMEKLWSPTDSKLFGNGASWDLTACAAPVEGDAHERVFFIPAQRVLSLRDGVTRPFTDYHSGDPFVLRQFSDIVHRLAQSEFAHELALFPQTDRLHPSLVEPIAEHVFGQFNLRIDSAEYQRRLILGDPQQGARLPYLVWSAGQREFVPLLLGFYWLLPPGGGRRAGVERVVIEEIEMGLHPKAISATMALVLELMARGYRVCLATHSPHVLDVVWAIQFMQQNKGTEQDVLDIFHLPTNARTSALAMNALRSILQVHYFRRNKSAVDISELDPGSDSSDMAGWGGLTEFSGHVGDIVARVARREETES